MSAVYVGSWRKQHSVHHCTSWSRKHFCLLGLTETLAKTFLADVQTGS